MYPALKPSTPPMDAAVLGIGPSAIAFSNFFAQMAAIKPTKFQHIKESPSGLEELHFVSHVHINRRCRILNLAGQTVKPIPQSLQYTIDPAAVMMIADINTYDMPVITQSETTKNALQATIDYYYAVLATPEYSRLDMLLFLNNFDAFEERLEDVPLATQFPGYPAWLETQSDEIQVGRPEIEFLVEKIHFAPPGNPDRMKFIYVSASTPEWNTKFLRSSVYDIVWKSENDWVKEKSPLSRALSSVFRKEKWKKVESIKLRKRAKSVPA